MQQIGTMKLDVENAKCDDATKNTILALAKKSEKWSAVSGNRPTVAKIEKVFNAILKGGKFEDVQAIFKETWPVAALSQGGAWMPKELHVKIGRVIEPCETVKIEKGVYAEKVDWMAENGMREPEATRPGYTVKCLACGEPMHTPEMAHQFYCAKCLPNVDKAAANGGTKERESVEYIRKDIMRYARAAIQKKGDPEIVARCIEEANKRRARLGLKPLTEKQISAGKVEAWV